MSVFSVDPIKLSKETETLQTITSVLRSNKVSLEKMRQSLRLSGAGGSSIKYSLMVTSEELEDIIKNIKSAEKVLSEISSKYVNTEKIISNQNIEQGDPAFDDEGSYGGNQSNPVTKSEELADIVRKYYPDFTDKEVEDYLKKLESEGCGYVAMSNTIFAQFMGKEKEFEKTFGFPMYDKNGDLNYDAMVTDFYAATDNHNEKGWIFKRDVVDESEDKSATEGRGTTRKKREYRWEKYMADHGIDVDVKNVKVTPENYDEVASKGDLVVGVHPCILYDESGNQTVDIDGGHAMTVTGKTDDGMYRVSSWGKEYYIKPDNSVYDRMQFQQIIY